MLRSILQLRTSVRACRLSLAKHALLNDHRAGWNNHLANNIAGGAAVRRTACFAGSLPLIQRFFCYSGVVLFADIHFRLYLSRRTSTPCPGAALANTEPVGSHLQNTPCSTIIVPGGSTILQTISPVVRLPAAQPASQESYTSFSRETARKPIKARHRRYRDTSLFFVAAVSCLPFWTLSSDICSVEDSSPLPHICLDKIQTAVAIRRLHYTFFSRETARKPIKARLRSAAIPRFSLFTFFSREKKVNGALSAIRTHDLLLRRELLCPAEL